MAKRRWDVGERVVFRGGGRVRLPAHRHVNPHRRRSSGGGGGGGGTNWAMIALVAGGAFLLMRSGALGGVLGGAGQTVTPQQLVAAGYQDMGGGYYRNAQTGQTVYRNPTTGRVQPTGGAVPPGTSPWIAPLYQIGQAAIPQIGAGIGSGIASLFNPQTWSNLFSTSTPTVNEAMGGTMPSESAIYGDMAALPPIGGTGYEIVPADYSLGGALPPLSEPLPDLGTYEFDTSWLDTYQLPALDSGVALYSPDLPDYGWMTSVELTPVEPVYPDATGWF